MEKNPPDTTSLGYTLGSLLGLQITVLCLLQVVIRTGQDRSFLEKMLRLMFDLMGNQAQQLETPDIRAGMEEMKKAVFKALEDTTAPTQPVPPSS